MGDEKSTQGDHENASRVEPSGSEGGASTNGGRGREPSKDAVVRKAEEQHRILFETMALGVVYQDAEGQIISANPAAQRILGLSLEQMTGRKSIDPRWKATREDGSEFPGEEHPAMVALRTGKSVNDTIMGVYNPKEESYRWISVNAIPLFQPGESSPYLVYTTFTDVTESKMLQEDRERQRNELELYASLLRHDFGNDLQIIIGLIETYELARSFDVEGMEQLLGSVKAASDRMNKLLAALGMPHGEKSETLSEMFSRVIETAAKVHQNLHVTLSIPKSLKALDVGSYRLLDTCFANLLRNSAEFGGKDTEAVIHVEHDNGSVSIRVSDNGPGIDSSILPDLFSRGTTTNSGGLGLYLTKQILETYGGAISLEKTSSEKGTTFLVTLPIARQ